MKPGDHYTLVAAGCSGIAARDAAGDVHAFVRINEGEPLPTPCDLVHFEEGEGKLGLRVRDVTRVPGPARASTRAYRAGWTRTFAASGREAAN